MTRRFMLDEGGADGDVVEPDTYTVEVIDARALEDKDFLWLDLKILGGPDDGRTVSVGLNMPDDAASRGAKFYFENKMRGFLPRTPRSVWELPDEQQAAGLAQALLNQRVHAKLSVQKEGPYKGSQQLEETKEVVEVAPAVRAAPAPVAVETETVVSASTGNNEPPTDPPF